MKSNKIKRVVPLVCGVGILAAAAACASPCLLMVAPDASVSAAVATRDVRSAFYPHIPTNVNGVIFIAGNRESAELFRSADGFLKMAGIHLPVAVLEHGVDICFMVAPKGKIVLLRVPDVTSDFPESLKSALPSGTEVKALSGGVFVLNPKNYDGLNKGLDVKMTGLLEALPEQAMAGMVMRPDSPEKDDLFMTGWIVEKAGGPAQLRLKLAGIPEEMRGQLGKNLAMMVENLKITLGSVGDKQQLEKAITVLSEAESGLWELGVELTPEVLHSIQASTAAEKRISVGDYKRKLRYGGIYHTMRDTGMLGELVKDQESLNKLHEFADEQAGKLLSGNIPLDDPGFSAAFVVNRAETDENKKMTAIRLLMADCLILNRAFGTPEKTIELFEELSEKQPEVARYAWYVVRDEVMDGIRGGADGQEARENRAKLCKLAAKYYPDPLASYLDFEKNTLVYVTPGRSASNINFHRDMLNRTANGLIAVARQQGKDEAAETINRRLKEFNRKADECAAASNRNAPKVASCVPANGAKNVEPGLNEITVTFDRGMSTTSWSFCQTDPEHFPEPGGRPYFSDGGLTVTMPVKLKPDTEYIIYLNSGRFTGFVSAADKIPLESYQYTFTTGSGSAAPDEAEEAVKQTSPAPKARAGRSLAEINEYCDTIIGDMEERGKQEAADILADFDRNVAGMKDIPEAESNDFLRRELKKVIWDSYTSAKWESMRFKDELKDAYRENAEPLSGLQDTFETRVMSAYRLARARAVSTGESYSASSRQKDEIVRSRAAEQEKRDAKRAREAAESEREQQRAAEQEREDAAISGGAAEK